MYFLDIQNLYFLNANHNLHNTCFRGRLQEIFLLISRHHATILIMPKKKPTGKIIVPPGLIPEIHEFETASILT